MVSTVRSPQKANHIKAAYPLAGKDNLDFSIVEDIARPNGEPINCSFLLSKTLTISTAFDKAVIAHPPFDFVIHAASPFHFNATNPQEEIIDPAVNGTVGILKSIQKNAPSVKRVIITSSFAAMYDPNHGWWKEHTYTENDWCPVTGEESLENPTNTYRASKTFAEKAAWQFVQQEKPGFSLTVCNPPLVLGPVIHHLADLSTINTSMGRIKRLVTGEAKEDVGVTGNSLWVDVRDIAPAHVLALETPEAAGQRFFIVAGKFSNKQISELIGEKYPKLTPGLPQGSALKSGDFPEPGNTDSFYKVDNTKSKKILGLDYRDFESCIVDSVNSLLAVLDSTDNT